MITRRQITLMALALGPMMPAVARASALSVSRFAQPGDGSVNTWILNGQNAVVVIDTQRALSAGRQAADAVAAIGKPVAAILITHPHPDHFSGLPSFLDRFPGTPVYASAATRDIMAADSNGFIAATKAVLGDDAPEVQPLPTHTFTDQELLVFDTVRLVVDEIGRGEADTMSMFYAPDEGMLFPGDVVENNMTPFMMEGHTLDWLAQVDRIVAAYGPLTPMVYPGHGAAGTMALFDKQRTLLTFVQDAVRAALPDGVTAAEINDIVATYHGRYPNHPPVAAIPNLMRENVRAVAGELARP